MSSAFLGATSVALAMVSITACETELVKPPVKTFPVISESTTIAGEVEVIPDSLYAMGIFIMSEDSTNTREQKIVQ